MKTTIKHLGSLAIVLTVAFIFSVGNVSLANDVKKDTFGVDLKHIGTIKNQPVFLLSVANVEGDDYTITITDESGLVLYEDRIRGTSLRRRFQLNTDEIEGNLFFEVKSRKSKKTEVYEINIRPRYVQETSVSKL